MYDKIVDVSVLLRVNYGTQWRVRVASAAYILHGITPVVKRKHTHTGDRVKKDISKGRVNVLLCTFECLIKRQSAQCELVTV